MLRVLSCNVRMMGGKKWNWKTKKKCPRQKSIFFRCYFFSFSSLICRWSKHISFFSKRHIFKLSLFIVLSLHFHNFCVNFGIFFFFLLIYFFLHFTLFLHFFWILFHILIFINYQYSIFFLLFLNFQCVCFFFTYYLVCYRTPPSLRDGWRSDIRH